MFLVLHPADSAGRLEACGLIAAACARRCQHADVYFVYDALQRGGHVGSHERPRRLGSPIGPSRSARSKCPPSQLPQLSQFPQVPACPCTPVFWLVFRHLGSCHPSEHPAPNRGGGGGA